MWKNSEFFSENRKNTEFFSEILKQKLGGYFVNQNTKIVFQKTKNGVSFITVFLCNGIAVKYFGITKALVSCRAIEWYVYVAISHATLIVVQPFFKNVTPDEITQFSKAIHQFQNPRHHFQNSEKNSGFFGGVKRASISFTCQGLVAFGHGLWVLLLCEHCVALRTSKDHALLDDAL